MYAGHFISILTTILSSISILIILSLGLGVIFGMRGIINLAHGEFVMLGAYMALGLVRVGIPFAGAVIGAGIAMGLVGAIIERTIVRRLYERPLDCILATWGISLILVQGITVLYGTNMSGLPIPFGNLRIYGETIGIYSLFLIPMAGALVLFTYFVFTRTRFGLQSRATMHASDTAEAVGINTSRINMFVFAMGSALAGLAGAVLFPYIGITPTMGQNVIAEVLLTVMVGGTGFLSGVPLSAGILGGVQSGLAAWLTPFVGSLGLLALAIVIVRVRPNGLTSPRRKV